MKDRMPMLLYMFHGRDDPDDQPENWGFTGPVLRIEGFHVTYLTTFRIGVPENVDPTRDWAELSFVGDCLHYDGKYYGDWSVLVPATSPELEAEAEDIDLSKLDAPILCEQSWNPPEEQ